MDSPRQTRKLQKNGGSTYVISLPRSWVDGMHLKTGDGISVSVNVNNSLTISPDVSLVDNSQAVAAVGPKDSDESIRRKVVAMYLAGYGSIKIMAKGIRLGPGQLNTVRKFIRSSMVGTEIVESSSEYITIKILTRLPELTFSTGLVRMCKMTTDMHREALEAVQSRDAEYAKEVVKLDDEIDRFTFYMLRNLNMAVSNASVMQEMSLGSPTDCMYYRTAVSRIERVADHAALIAKRVKYLSEDVDTEIMSRIQDLSVSVMDIFSMSIDALVSSDYASAEDISRHLPHMEAAQEELMMSIKKSSPDVTVIKFILDSIRRSLEYTADIAEVVMDLNIGRIIDVNVPHHDLVKTLAG
ncbi:MAG: phosphate uptake regulator PhoU [Cenarchaeum sp. SB0665_bin_23]|nr:phosphate uptake regulator PhoU [Cenarchaeum sp. SB0665_bin_23]MYG32818.1 phosphate uptake regulator PhoU [Cenarchaeum sp. SB0677_bin_16]